MKLELHSFLNIGGILGSGCQGQKKCHLTSVQLEILNTKNYYS